MKFKLSKYIIPSIISMVVVGTNANIDGFFIGGILGDNGLAAINIAWPIVAFIASLGTGIGVGGSVILNKLRGEGNTKKAEKIKNTTIFLLVTAGVLVGLLLYLFRTPILEFMGANGEVLKHSDDYSKVISVGAICQIVGAGMLVLLRNDSKTYQSMVYSLSGLVLHIVLDFAFASKLIMPGVALATVLSQGVICVLSFVSLKIDKTVKFDMKEITYILKETAAPFGINFVPSLVLFFTNIFALKTGGVAAVSAYAAMSYAVYTFDYIFQGICDGIQPIISYCKGSNDKAEEKRAVMSAAIIIYVFSLICAVLTPALIKILPVVLGVSSDALSMIKTGMWIYALSYPFKATVKFVCSYYYASGKALLSNILVYLDPIVFTPGFLILMTKFAGVNGVWLSMPFAQILLTIVATSVILQLRKYSK